MSDDHSFHALGLRDELLTRLQQMEFTQMTPVQAAALPSALQGKDVVAGEHRQRQDRRFCAGLSAAFGKYKFRFSRWYFVQPAVGRTSCRGFRELAKHLANTKVTTLCGGVAIGPEIGSLQHSAHVVVGTPGRVLKHLQKGTLRLQGLNALVLDEADRMLDMGFEEEIDAIFAYLPSPRQNLLFSATFPDEVAHVVKALSPYAERIDVTGTELAPSIVERWCHAPAQREFSARVQALGDSLRHWGGRLNLVFCNTKLDCAVSRQLDLLGFSAVALHGDMEQHERSQTLIRFSNGSANVLVATDVAARGSTLMM